MPDRDWSWKTIPQADYDTLVAARETLFRVYLLLDDGDWTLERLREAVRLAREAFPTSQQLQPSWLPTPPPPLRLVREFPD